MKYTAPEFEIFEVAVEGGYGNSTLLPGFGSEEDELTYQEKRGSEMEPFSLVHQRVLPTP